MGSRYGGLKQIDPVGKNGEIIMDFSVFDAVQAGFSKVIFIIKEQLFEDFKEVIGDRVSKYVQVEYVFQKLDDLPEGFTVPEGREKPWGTGHRNVKEDSEKAHWAMVGYHLKNTLTENGHVARGVCVEKDGVLDTIVERTHIEKREDGPAYTEDDGATWHALDEDTTVSMNLWGFTPDFVDALKKDFVSFLENDVPKNPLKAEYFLPFVVNDQIRDGKADVTVLKSADKWFGVTYKADKPVVMAALAEMMQNGTYPDPLWK